MRPALLSVAIALAFAGTCGGDVIAYLRFEENGGGIAADDMGLLDGELVNFSDTSPGGGDLSGRGWSTSVPSATVPLTGEANTSSIRMNGGSGYVDLSNANALDLGSEFTIEFYMKPDQPVIGSPTFGFEPSSSLFCPLVAIGDDLMWRPQFQDQLELIPADLVTTGSWQHFALVVEPTQYSVYIDGQTQYVGPIPLGGEGPYYFPGDVTLGTRTIGGDSGTWRGYIDEFRISDEALTPDQFLIAVPEPGTLFLCFSGLATLFLSWLKRRFG